MGAPILLPGDKVKVAHPNGWPGLGDVVGTIFDAMPSEIAGFDHAVQFGKVRVLMFADEVVPA